MYDITEIIFGMYLLDFYERKYNTIISSSTTELEHLRKVYPDEIDEQQDYIVGDKHIEQTLARRLPLIHKILEFGKGKISLCGLSVLDIMFWTDENFFDFDLYIHSCDLSEANALIEQCISLPVVNIILEQSYFRMTLLDEDGEEYYIRIFLNIYRDRNQILKNIGPILFRHGYDFEARYFSTFSSALSLIIKVAPIDIFPDTNKLDLFSGFGILSIFHGKTNVKFDDPKSLKDITIYDCRRCNLYSMPVTNILNEDNGVNIITTRLFKEAVKPLKDPRDYFGKDYVPIVIGIDDDSYVALSGIKKKFGICCDLFRIICNYWLEVLLFDTKERLMNRLI